MRVLAPHRRHRGIGGGLPEAVRLVAVSGGAYVWSRPAEGKALDVRPAARVRSQGRSLMVIIVMGISGTGKTTLGTLLAQRLGWTFIEGDEYHPAVNIARMRSGIPLTDADRGPWLRALAERIGQASEDGEDLVVACSALRRAYRETLTGGARDGALLVWLDATAEVIEPRLRVRRHFMPPELLPSQLATAEPPAPDEGALRLPADAPPVVLVDRVLAVLQGMTTS